MLICPECQSDFDWTADLDRCPVCGSIHLFRRLGEVECRDCGCVGQPAEAAANPVTGLGAGEGAADPGNAGDGGASSELAREVELALSRVLGPSRQRPPYAMS